ncbi:monosaccharide ABC transporter membrane protein (CUT2 family) [Acidovorax sp. 100]|uniref:ABC transporter permease n=1 Tax=Acidovorax sp. 100 TaxID=2135635 RepID=UPI000EF9974B|nr:ABC transporter permease [Acidovorax sp. 100]RMA61383.1 monosaccharide ABC transporter membrane protein (CUT2 family) [Acidovorax sp. 100]
MTTLNPARTGLTRYTLGLPVVLVLLLAATQADFRSTQNLLNFSGQIGALLIVAMGQLFVTLVAGIDLSVGSVMSLASAFAATQSDPLAAVAMATALGVAVGTVNGMGVAMAGVHPLVMTLSTATFLQGLAYVVLPIPGGTIASAMTAAATGEAAGIPAPLLWCAAAALAARIVLRRTRFGAHLFAVGGHPRSAYLNGVRVKFVVVGAYVWCSVAAAWAGLFLAARVAAGDPALGASYALESVAAVALGGVQLTGGVGSVAGVVAGVLSLGLMTNGLNLFGVSPFMRGVLTGVLLLAAVSLQRRRIVGM